MTKMTNIRKSDIAYSVYKISENLISLLEFVILLYNMHKTLLISEKLIYIRFF